MTLNTYVPFSAVPKMLRSNAVSASFTAEPFTSLDEENAGLQELADLDQGSTLDFPTGVDPVRLQRVVSAMVRFGLLPPGLAFYPITAMLGS